MKITRMIALTTLFLAVSLFPSLALPTASAATASATATPTDPPSKIYRIGLDGKKQTLVAQLPAVHRASMSPSGRFVYAEKQGFTNNAPTIPYLYDTKTKQFSQLNGFAKWASGKDELLMVEQASLYRYNPLTKQKTLLANGTADTPILDYAMAPDGHYLVFVQANLKEPDATKRYKLYLQDMNSLKMKVNDQFSLSDDQLKSYMVPDLFYWVPTSKKVLYKANGAIKELDLPTGLKYTYSFKNFPSYSNDMKLRFEDKQGHGFITDLQTGKSVSTQDNYTADPNDLERQLTRIYWSPTGHNYVADKYWHPSNGQDFYAQLVIKTTTKSFVYPFDNSFYMNSSDNIQFLGWAADGKSFFVGDLDSVHMSRFDKWEYRER
ncbi:TolB family protein [Brevibacillus parabrevis]|uniref:TolB family protein n=1 Tax=Brevibacillus parabrevis TaxID=54914 RepID=UPI001F6040E8|nr:hypothetical protein [Brevibacillus parabrevis]